MSGESDLVRVARIGDSVFAVTLTLLAYRVRIPEPEVLTGGQLLPLLPFLRELAAVLLSFLVASMFWLAHWRIFRRMQHSDLRFVALNLAYLCTLILLPISTSVFSATYGTRVGSLTYGGNLFLAATAGFFLRRHACRLDPQAFGPGRVLLSSALLLALFGSALLVSLRWPGAASFFWWAGLATPWIDNRWGVGRAPPPGHATPGAPAAER